MTASTGSAGITRPMVNVTAVRPTNVSTSVSKMLSAGFKNSCNHSNSPVAAAGVIFANLYGLLGNIAVEN